MTDQVAHAPDTVSPDTAAPRMKLRYYLSQCLFMILSLQTSEGMIKRCAHAQP